MVRKSRLTPVACYIALLGTLLLSSCNKNVAQTPSVFRMGERMQVGPLIYTVIENRWAEQLGDAVHPRLPKQRFLLVRLSVTNSGGKEASVPFLNLQNNRGQEFGEEQSGEGIEGWLGFLRPLKPADTDTGWIVFDVPANSYNLRVSAEVEGGDEQSLLIHIPFSIDGISDAPPKSAP